MSERTREQEIFYRCAIYDATNAATKILEDRGVPESALVDLCGWVLFVVRDMLMKDGKSFTDAEICAAVLQSIRDAGAFYDTMD